MARSKFFLLLGFHLCFCWILYAAPYPGSAIIQQGVLQQIWEDRQLPSAPDQPRAVELFLLQNRNLLGLNDNPDVTLKLTSVTECAIGQRYVYSQFAHNLPVFTSQVVLIAREFVLKSLFNEISTAHFGFQPAKLSSAQALQTARNATGNLALNLNPTIELGYSRTGDLIYLARLSVVDPPAAWEIWLAAGSGEILCKVDRRIFIDGHGQVFDPDPKTALECDTLHDWNNVNWAIPTAAYDTVTLFQLDPPIGGFYHLEGPYVTTSPTSNRASEPTPNFFYWRADARFEEAMVYYLIDREQRYFQNQLQTFNANNRCQVVDVNGTTEDNSWYNPYNQVITYGSGGVDDAEDADVILHEYGHATQSNICGLYWGYLGHTGAMGEGYGDYRAGSYSLSINSTFNPDWVFTWDGHNQFWPGRWLNMPYHYPENAGGEIHDAGQLWSAGLMDVWWDIPDRIAWDRIVLQHHFLLGISALMADAAQAILTTELNLYGGLYRGLIIENFGARGFINPANYSPIISTEPLHDTEDTLQAQFEVTAQITSQVPLDPTGLLLSYRADEEPFTFVPLTPAGAPNQYHAYIPGPFNNQTVSYYLAAADTTGMGVFSPANAPSECYQFHVGIDLTPPTVVWTDSLGETIFPRDTLTVRAMVTDNTSIETVELLWQVESGEMQSAPLAWVAADTFQGFLVYYCPSFDQTVRYHVRATDGSSQANVTEGPEQSFTISTTASLDDFEGALGDWITNGHWGVSSQWVHSPTHSMEDSPGTTYLSNSDSWLQWSDSWDLSDLTTARLVFWGRAMLQAGHDFGRLEISVDNEPWQVMMEASGLDSMFHQHEISLDALCGGLSHDVRARFRVITDDSLNLFGWFIDDVSLATSSLVPTEPENQTPISLATFALHSVTPNPFNATTIISYQLPRDSHVRVQIYDTVGRRVAILVESWEQAGTHEVTFKGQELASGLYFVRLQAGSLAAVRKMLLLK
jgi:hypothetical protein